MTAIPLERLWICPRCRQTFTRRWSLKKHLIQKYHVPAAKAQIISERSEFWLKVDYRYLNPADFYYEE